MLKTKTAFGKCLTDEPYESYEAFDTADNCINDVDDPFVGLANVTIQDLFTQDLINALDPSFIFDLTDMNETHPLNISVSNGTTKTGLVDANGDPLVTKIWGYGPNDGNYTWPGMTIETKEDDKLFVQWKNDIPIADGYLITGKCQYKENSTVDESLHWAYSLHDYKNRTIADDGTPIVPHFHGGHTAATSDGNPEYFFSPGWKVRGPLWGSKVYEYANDQPAATNWYHDHALGITRLNVYAGMAGFYIIRDDCDTGDETNTINVPYGEYEVLFVIQDRMFKDNGDLFYPAFKGDPAWSDFIDDDVAYEGKSSFLNEGPSQLAEFFGNFMTVNGAIWPKKEVKQSQYRLRMLNGCDSRFLVLRFVYVSDTTWAYEDPIPNGTLSGGFEAVSFQVIGSDQGLTRENNNTEHNYIVVEPGARYDIIVNFTGFDANSTIILQNLGGDVPFGGDIPGERKYNEDSSESEDSFIYTDRIMAFNVTGMMGTQFGETNLTACEPRESLGEATRTRRLCLFEGTDEHGRLQPLLGTCEPATDKDENEICYPDQEDNSDYQVALLSGTQMEGASTWHDPTTENPASDAVEIWEIWNLSADAHPMHVHLVHMEFINSTNITFDSYAPNDGVIPLTDSGSRARNGTFISEMNIVEHSGNIGTGWRAYNLTASNETLVRDGYYDAGYPKDMIVALPGQVTIIKMKFDRVGHYVWHCHILSHEDHEMMRPFHVGGDIPEKELGGSSCLTSKAGKAGKRERRVLATKELKGKKRKE